MKEEKITAFPDGNSFTSFNQSLNSLIIGNSEGLVKVFDISQPDLEPTSIDISDNLTSLANHSGSLLITNVSGTLELVDLSSQKSKGIIYRSELPLRDSVFINDGKRILCGGDDTKLALIDLENSYSVNFIDVADQVLNISYNFSGEISAVSLSDGSVQLYSVVNEIPSLVNTVSSILPSKINTSMEALDFNGEHIDELLATKTRWSSDGEHLFIPTNLNTIRVYSRSDWSQHSKEFKASDARIVDFALSPNGKNFAVLYLNSTVVIFDINNTKQKVDEISFILPNSKPINIEWSQNEVYVGTSYGEVMQFKVDISKDINNLFVEEAEEDEEGSNTDRLLNDSEAEEERNADDIRDISDNDLNLHEEDSMVIDQDDDERNQNGHHIHSEKDGYHDRKRQKLNKNGVSFAPSVREIEFELKPYSPGSTPWKNERKKASSADRRYMFMNSIGYVWSVKNVSYEEPTDQQTITVTFFDRTDNKDYHFIDSAQFDICSINSKGLLLGASNHKGGSSHGLIYYRNHDGNQDAWEKKIPLLKNEFLTSVAVTNCSKDTSDSDAVIVVGTNFGYVRVFNLYGVYLNILKTPPLVTLIASKSNTILLINQIASTVYTYSLIDTNSEYKFIQQDVLLPLKNSPYQDVPLIKGLFFNEYNDPCIVPGIDDTLLILQSWRETNNAKWVPLLNCNNILTEYGTNSNKKHWKCWPLGLNGDQLNCLILKNHNQYPEFPLPLPFELGIQMPIVIPDIGKKGRSSSEEPGAPENELHGSKDKEDPEELFLRSLTMGKIVSDSLNDEDNEEDNDEIMQRLEQYSIVLDKSLLKLFGEACKEYKLKKAFSVARLIKSDKGLFAASKICERMEFANLASKISKLREAFVDIDDDD